MRKARRARASWPSACIPTSPGCRTASATSSGSTSTSRSGRACCCGQASRSLTGTDRHAELWARAEALLPRLRERAARCEELRRIPDETLRDFHDAELFRIHQPKRVGGAELEFAAVVTFGALFARACASTSWVWVNYAAHHMMLGMWPREAQDEIWSKDRDALIASSFVFPAAKARKVEGGYSISGRWPFSSGVHPSEWNMLAGLAFLDDNAPPEQRVFLLHRSQYA